MAGTVRRLLSGGWGGDRMQKNCLEWKKKSSLMVKTCKFYSIIAHSTLGGITLNVKSITHVDRKMESHREEVTDLVGVTTGILIAVLSSLFFFGSWGSKYNTPYWPWRQQKWLCFYTAGSKFTGRDYSNPHPLTKAPAQELGNFKASLLTLRWPPSCLKG